MLFLFGIGNHALNAKCTAEEKVVHQEQVLLFVGKSSSLQFYTNNGFQHNYFKWCVRCGFKNSLIPNLRICVKSGVEMSISLYFFLAGYVN
jgi:hypothetical protein